MFLNTPIFSISTSTTSPSFKNLGGSNGIEFEERDIRKNDQYLHELIGLGAVATPATVIKDGDKEEVILGFDQTKLAEILGI